MKYPPPDPILALRPHFDPPMRLNGPKNQQRTSIYVSINDFLLDFCAIGPLFWVKNSFFGRNWVIFCVINSFFGRKLSIFVSFFVALGQIFIAYEHKITIFHSIFALSTRFFASLTHFFCIIAQLFFMH